MSRRTVPERAAGFTLVEVLVALAVVSVLLTAIGSLVATTVRGVRAVDDRITVVQAARAVAAGLPGRTELALGALTGNVLGLRWRAEVTPFVAEYVDPRRPTPWLPQSVVITVQSSGGPAIRLETVRLRRQVNPG